jgi:hypothetical protein
VAVLVVIMGGYVALKGIKRMRSGETQVFTSIHSIWANGVSLSFAVLAGWLFWRVVNTG